LQQDWDDDDLPEWTDDQFDRTAIWHGDKLIRPADGTLTKPGRPKLKNPKQHARKVQSHGCGLADPDQ